MTKLRKDMRFLFGLLVIILLISIPINPISLGEFILPSHGGGMVHQDQNMSENIRWPCPTINVGELWYRDDIGGKLLGGLRGTFGNSIAGNGNISACSFGPLYLAGSRYYKSKHWDIWDVKKNGWGMKK